MLSVGDIVRLDSVSSPGEGGALALVIEPGRAATEDEIMVAPLTAVAAASDDGRVLRVTAESLLEGQVTLQPCVARLDRLNTVRARSCCRVARLKSEAVDALLRKLVGMHTRRHYELFHKPRAFEPGVTSVPVSGRVYGPEEMETLVDSALDFWLTAGRYNEAFEKRLAEFLGAAHVMTTNSGSSANLLALTALMSEKLGDRRLKPGDEVITVAAGFPTTVNPVFQNRLVPVFVDVELPTYNVKPELVEAAIGERTRAIILAHTLGNPFDVSAILRLVRERDLWLIEDCCDALGAAYRLPCGPGAVGGGPSRCGTFGHISTFSFYPAHHITMGEGGAVATSDPRLRTILESLRDWGRDCWCAPGRDDTCRRRFDWQWGTLPRGYDHKYVYSHMGYNLKITEMQAAIALAQMGKLPEFLAARQRNFDLLKSGLQALDDVLVLPEPTPNSIPSWFGFPLTLRDGAGLDREDLLRQLNARKIGTRLLFGGNLLRQPYLQQASYRVHPPSPVGASSLPNSDVIMRNTFWLGVYPGLTPEHIRYVVQALHELVRGHR